MRNVHFSRAQHLLSHAQHPLLNMHTPAVQTPIAQCDVLLVSCVAALFEISSRCACFRRFRAVVTILSSASFFGGQTKHEFDRKLEGHETSFAKSNINQDTLLQVSIDCHERLRFWLLAELEHARGKAGWLEVSEPLPWVCPWRKLCESWVGLESSQKQVMRPPLVKRKHIEKIACKSATIQGVDSFSILVNRRSLRTPAVFPGLPEVF